MSLNRPVKDRHVEQIGHSTLTVGPGSRAVWTFAANGGTTDNTADGTR